MTAIFATGNMLPFLLPFAVSFLIGALILLSGLLCLGSGNTKAGFILSGVGLVFFIPALLLVSW